jgi:hypothetical protein
MNKMTLGATAQPRHRLDMMTGEKKGEKEGLFKAISRSGGQMFVVVL